MTWATTRRRADLFVWALKPDGTLLIVDPLAVGLSRHIPGATAVPGRGTHP